MKNRNRQRENRRAKYQNYPSWVYSIREDVTRANMKAYDHTTEIFRQKCLEIDPDYYSLSLRERMTVKDKVEEILGYRR